MKPQELNTIHFTEMQKQLLRLGKAKQVGRILNSPFRKLPTVASFKVDVQPYNMFLEKLNIKLRLPAKTEYKKNEFDVLNKYMERVIRRINKAVKSKNYTKA
jgi:hypothetical protein